MLISLFYSSVFSRPVSLLVYTAPMRKILSIIPSGVENEVFCSQIHMNNSGFGAAHTGNMYTIMAGLEFPHSRLSHKNSLTLLSHPSLGTTTHSMSLPRLVCLPGCIRFFSAYLTCCKDIFLFLKELFKNL